MRVFASDWNKQNRISYNWCHVTCTKLHVYINIVICKVESYLHWLDSGNQNNLQKKFKGEAMLCTICNVPLVPKVLHISVCTPALMIAHKVEDAFVLLFNKRLLHKYNLSWSTQCNSLSYGPHSINELEWVSCNVTKYIDIQLGLNQTLWSKPLFVIWVLSWLKYHCIQSTVFNVSTGICDNFNNFI